MHASVIMKSRKIPVGISLAPDLFARIEMLRKGRPRSVFISELIDAAVSDKQKNGGKNDV